YRLAPSVLRMFVHSDLVWRKRQLIPSYQRFTTQSCPKSNNLDRRHWTANHQPTSFALTRTSKISTVHRRSRNRVLRGVTYGISRANSQKCARERCAVQQK